MATIGLALPVNPIEDPRPNINVILLGNSGSGKTTVGGHTMFVQNCVETKRFEQITKFNEVVNKSPYTFVLDILKSERELFQTHNLKAPQLLTPQRRVTLIDVPGKRSMGNQMMAGITQADHAILVVSAATGEFELGLKSEPSGKDDEPGCTKEHMLLAYSFGIRNVIIAVNKMDHPTVSFSEERFKDVSYEVKSILKMYGFDLANVTLIPVSGTDGDNIKERSAKTPWYTGKTLVEAIDTLPEVKRPTDLPLRLPVTEVYKISGIGTVIMGRIETGVLKTGMKIAFSPGNIDGECSSIEIHYQGVQEARAGDYVGFNIKGINRTDVLKGQVACDANNKPASEITEFVAQIVVLRQKHPIEVGYKPVIYCHRTMVACKMTAILEKMDQRTGKVIEKNPKSIKAGDAATVRFVPTKPMVVEVYQNFAPLGRFAVRDMKQTVAVGVIKEITKKVEVKK